ncbi:hypothetical protein JTE90_017020 [Oedothorax gibbosus]|uniref:Uncharacterized protein n=1 Tax=Oedothorax gibbosus TaxID=931172 RepID=A0AAV6UL92_9ARAC|nr:hypothetical protein JTE90_017020 [Oedothorax gibbosus]
MFTKGSFVLLVAVCCVWMVTCNHHDQIPEPSFLSALASRVLETEPREIREFRTSCIREPGCRWKCPSADQCLCVCGRNKKKRA